MRIIHNNILNILKLLSCGLLLWGLSSCSDDQMESQEGSNLDSKSQIVLSFTMSNEGASTRAEDDPLGYESGINYENYINVSGGDFKIYFFTYDEGDVNGGTLIAEFTPTRITSSSTSSSTTYTMSGVVPEDLIDVSDFRVVMLANWGNYPSTEVGTTTIDGLCQGDNTTFSAADKFTIDQDHLIPFYGVQEYSDVSFTSGKSTTLKAPVRLLRALAKVEVIMSEDSEVETFDGVSIVNYNTYGYCAPAGVYTSDDYNADLLIGSDNEKWSSVFTDLHLFNNANDTGTKTQSFTQVTDATQDTWSIYVPEYDNSGDEDYSYITVTINGTDYPIYFANYDEDGKTNNEDVSNRYDLKRNNLYRFYVIVNEASEESITVRVYVKPWTRLQAEEFEF